MATRVGIELAPDACRIVEIDAGPVWARRGHETRVRSFAVLPPSGPETQAKLESLRKRSAAVVVWTASDHRQVMVSAGSYESMRAEAMGSLAAAGLQTRGVWADIAPAAGSADRSARRAVVVALASGSEMTAALQPLRAAGIRLRTVTTPAVALASLARLRRAFSVPDALEVYVALEEHVTCIAIVRGGVLLAARDFAWGYVDEGGAGIELRHRDDITTRLVETIEEFVAAVGGSPGDLGQVCVCGGLPELRSMTAPLMERLDVEVEPLDSLFGIDAANLPDPVDEFRERGAELRLAWAVAADWPAPINMLRARNRQVSKTMLARAAVASGIAAGLVVGWRVQQNAWWRTTTATPPARTATNVRPAGRATPPAAVASKAPAMTAPAAVASKPPVVTPPPTVASKAPMLTPPPTVASKAPVVTPPPTVASKAPVVTPPPAVASKAPVVTPPPAVASKAPVVTPPPVVASKPSVMTPPAVVASKAPPPSPAVPTRPAASLPRAAATPVVVPPQDAPPPARTVVARPPVEPRVEPRPPVPTAASATPPVAPQERASAAAQQEPAATPARARARPAPAPEVPQPFDAVLGTILYSPDRKLAIVDGRIVGPGDEVRGARVVDITPTAVMFRDGQGRLRRLTLGAGGR